MVGHLSFAGYEFKLRNTRVKKVEFANKIKEQWIVEKTLQ